QFRTTVIAFGGGGSIGTLTRKRCPSRLISYVVLGYPAAFRTRNRACASPAASVGTTAALQFRPARRARPIPGSIAARSRHGARSATDPRDPSRGIGARADRARA